MTFFKFCKKFDRLSFWIRDTVDTGDTGDIDNNSDNGDICDIE